MRKLCPGLILYFLSTSICFSQNPLKHPADAIEMRFSINAIVDQVCVIGSGLPQPMALLTLSETGRKRSTEELHTELKNMLKDINSSLDPHEKVFKIIVLREQWLVENNLLTASLKIKRNKIEKRYAAFYEEWFETNGSIVLVDEQQTALIL